MCYYKKIAVVVLCVVLCSMARSQSRSPSGRCDSCVTPGMDLTLTSQEQIDHYRQLYGCAVVGNLTISGEDISNLDGLSPITTIQGALFIQNNPSLVDVSGLNNLEFLGRNISISNNAILQRIRGFNKLESISVQLAVAGNASLISIGGFKNFKTMYGGIEIFNNPLLTSLQGLKSLEAIQGNGSYYQVGLVLVNNDALKTLKDLSSLQRIDGTDPLYINISDNNVLNNLDGFRSLTFIEVPAVEMIISNNSGLTNIDGFSNVSHFRSIFQPAFITITDNPVLEVCCSVLVLTSEDQPSTYTLSGNAPSCSYEEITRPGGPCIPEEVQLSAAAVSIFPNPSNGKFSVMLSHNYSGRYGLIVKDITGTPCIESYFTKESVPWNVDVDMSKLPRGLYMALIYRGEKLVASKRIMLKD